MTKRKDPWTDPDPQPGDFDEEIERATPDQFGGVVFDPGLTINLISNEEAAERLGPEKAERLGLVPPKKPARR